GAGPARSDLTIKSATVELPWCVVLALSAQFLVSRDRPVGLRLAQSVAEWGSLRSGGPAVQTRPRRRPLKHGSPRCGAGSSVDAFVSV
ncbi:MAG: hypothetical protein ACKOGA_08555, partial [Planctomycetaceae bacterium]